MRHQAHFFISIHAPRGGSDREPVSIMTPERNFNPRSPWGERPVLISIRPEWVEFQSTLPVGGATENQGYLHQTKRISIHAPRGGSDAQEGQNHMQQVYFNPRSPWGERLPDRKIHSYNDLFQSTLPVGGATQHCLSP